MKDEPILRTGLKIMVEELRNPLACIMLSAEMLQQDNLQDSEKQCIIDIIRRQCTSVNNNIAELCGLLNNVDCTEALV